jgi:Ca2+-transporting ATPase
VVRGGHKDQISSWDLMVGDLIELVPGDEVPADGIYLHGTELSIDESPLTGESHAMRKNEENPFLFSGCQVNVGMGYMVATAVGERSSGGQIQKILNEQQGIETVLQEKLKVVAVQIGKIGVAAGIATFLALAIRLAVNWLVSLINS